MIELTELIEAKRGDDIVRGKAKVQKKIINSKRQKDVENIDTSECFGDEIPVDHDAVCVTIRTADEFDIPPTYVLDIEVQLSKL